MHSGKNIEIYQAKFVLCRFRAQFVQFLNSETEFFVIRVVFSDNGCGDAIRLCTSGRSCIHEIFELRPICISNILCFDEFFIFKRERVRITSCDANAGWYPVFRFGVYYRSISDTPADITWLENLAFLCRSRVTSRE
jgi:hypothetical protein